MNFVFITILSHPWRDSGLIVMTITEEKIFVPVSQVSQLEKLVRLYYEIKINLEGFETKNLFIATDQ